MNINSRNLKLTIGAIYLIVLTTGLFFLFSIIDLKDLTSYEFIRSNKDQILEYKNNNFFFLSVTFFIFSIIWVLLLGFGLPLLLFAGFVFGKWWGIILIISSTTIGATLLYILAGLFFKDIIEQKLAPKFLKLKKFFNKNEILYFTFFRFVGGGGLPYGIQNVLPVLFDMSVRNYFISSFIGSFPSMFVTVALADGIENYIGENDQISFMSAITSEEIYIPIIGFFIILLIAFTLKRFFFNKD